MRKIILILTCGICSNIYGQTNTGVMAPPQQIQNLNIKTQHEGKIWFVVSGTALVASGICSVIALNEKEPSVYDYSNYGLFKKDITSFENKQKNLKTAVSALNTLAGVCLIMGVTIHIKDKKK